MQWLFALRSINQAMWCIHLNTGLEEAGQDFYFQGIYNTPISATELSELPSAG